MKQGIKPFAQSSGTLPHVPLSLSWAGSVQAVTTSVQHHFFLASAVVFGDHFFLPLGKGDGISWPRVPPTHLDSVPAEARRVGCLWPS